MDADRILCARCDREKQLGHLDPDNLRWYCEDCWMEFSGKSRLCFRCRDFVLQGSVDARDKRWYCTKCWEFYTKAPRERSRSRTQRWYRDSPLRRSPVRQYPSQRVFLTPNPAVATNGQQYVQPAPAPYQPPVQYPQQPVFNAPPYQQQMAPQMPMQHYMQPQPQLQPYMPPQPQMPMPDISYAPMNNMNGMLGPFGNQMPRMDFGKGMDMDIDLMARNMGLQMPPNMGPNPFAPMGFGFNGKMGKGMEKGKKGKGDVKGKGAKGGFYDQPAGSPSTTSADRPRRFQGVVKDFGQKGPFGFINCVETAALYGRDVFIHKVQLGEALGRSIDDYPEMRNEDFEVPIEFAVTTSNEKCLPQARDCWLVEDEVLRAKLMRDAGIDPTKRPFVARNGEPPEPQTQVRALAPFEVPTPPPPVQTPDSSESDNASKSSRADSDKNSDSNDSDKDSDKESDKDDSDKEDSDKADHDDV